MSSSSNTRKRPSSPTPARKAKFLASLCAGDTVIAAAEKANLDRVTFYRQRTTDEKFAAAWDEAVEHGTDLLEAEAQRRAIEGVDDFKVGPNGQFVEFRKYSDTLLIFLLKARRPGKFRDNATVEHTGPGGGPIQTEETGVKATSLADVIRLARELGVPTGTEQASDQGVART